MKNPFYYVFWYGLYSTGVLLGMLRFSLIRKFLTIFLTLCYSKTFLKPNLFFFFQLWVNTFVSNLSDLRLTGLKVSFREHSESLAEFWKVNSSFIRERSLLILKVVTKLLSRIYSQLDIITFFFYILFNFFLF